MQVIEQVEKKLEIEAMEEKCVPGETIACEA